jgi:hypothetical protein
LNPDVCPPTTISIPLVNRRTTIPFSQLKESAEPGNCQAFTILTAGLGYIDQGREDLEDGGMQNQMFQKLTLALLLMFG